MIRVVIGSAAAAVVMFIIGFIFFGLGLQNLAIKNVGDIQAAPIQQVLAREHRRDRHLYDSRRADGRADADVRHRPGRHDPLQCQPARWRG